MASVQDSRFAADFHALLNTVELSLGVLGIGLIVHETLRRWKRDTRYWRVKAEKRDISAEDLGFGNLMHGRQFLAHRPSPPLSKWPLGWVWQAFWLREDWYRTHCGIDAATYIRFLRACWFFVVAQLLTTFPTLLAINWTRADDAGLTSDDLARASLSSLITSEYGKSFLWLQVLFQYWLCFSWMALIIWVGVGVLRHRRAQLAEALAERPATLDARAGWRFRTVLVSNIPSDLGLRNEQALIDYFESGLQYLPGDDDVEEGDLPLEAISAKMEKVGSSRGLISQVVVVRRSAELQSQWKRREEALHQLEVAHIQLAKNVLRAVDAHRNLPKKATAEDRTRLDAILKALEPYLNRDRAEEDRTIWEVLTTLPRELLDPYQPMHRLRKRFKGQSVPAMDYWLLKFQVLHNAVREKQEHPERIPPAADAFVTFRYARDARRACRHMAAHPTRLFAVKVRPAPDARDIIWEKIVIASFRSDVLRSIVTHALIWFATLVWILPISLFVALISLDNIAQNVPALARWLAENPKAKALLTNVVPTLAVSIISFIVPSLLSQITMRAQHISLVSKLHHRIGYRYFVFLMTNIVVLFSIGTAAIKAVFTDPADAFAPGPVLGRVAAAFPAAAVFYVSWLVLTMGLQNGFEIMLFGFAWIGANVARKAASPRRREQARILRQMNTYVAKPQTVLALSIFNIFSLLNSLVIPFAFTYFTVSLIVLKNQFAHVYGRNHWESNGRIGYMRFLRFSIDGLIITCIVFIAFFFINSQGRYGAATIVMLVVLATFKLVATRWFKAMADALDVTEADIYTGEPLHAGQDVISIHLLPSILRGLPGFRRLVLRIPAIRLSAAKRIEKRASLLAPLSAAGRESRASAATETRPMLQQPSVASLATTADRAYEGTALSRQGSSSEPAAPLPSLVRPHPLLLHNDWPNHNASYEDPFFTKPLEEYLWLPRDPLAPLDLNDTIEWRGLALVSSAGENGRIWAIEEISAMTLEELPAAADEATQTVEPKASLYPAALRPSASPSSAASPLSPTPTNRTGNERILTAAEVGTRSAIRSKSPRRVASPLSASFASATPEAPTTAGQTGYFPSPRRSPSPSAIQRLSSRLVSSPALPNEPGTISQAEALREEVLAEEQDGAAALKKEEEETRADETNEERKAAARDSRRFFSRGSDTNQRTSWLRRFANVTDP